MHVYNVHGHLGVHMSRADRRGNVSCASRNWTGTLFLALRSLNLHQWVDEAVHWRPVAYIVLPNHCAGGCLSYNTSIDRSLVYKRHFASSCHRQTVLSTSKKSNKIWNKKQARPKQAQSRYPSKTKTKTKTTKTSCKTHPKQWQTDPIQMMRAWLS